MHNVLVTIIGAGPAGLAAAIQLKRYGLNPLLLESTAVGGLLRSANWVENYPGFPGGISGRELAELFQDQARRSGIEVTFEEVTSLTYSRGQFCVLTGAHVYLSPIVVIATGTKPKRLADLHIPDTLKDRIFHDIYPLLEVKGRRVAILGAGDAAFDYALNLSRGNDVSILNRGAQVKCLPLLWKRAGASPRIAYHERTAVVGLGETPSGELILDCASPFGRAMLTVDYLIVAIGRDPQLDFASSLSMEISEPLKRRGVLYLIGDANHTICRQTTIAVGEGVLAAMEIYRYLKETKAENHRNNRE